MHENLLPKQLLKILKWKYPLYSIPKLSEYSQSIIDFSKKNNQLPYYSKFDINNDGHEEIIIIHRSIVGGYGRLLIIAEKKGKFTFESIKWDTPVNSLFSDYFIDVAVPRTYQTVGFIGQEDSKKWGNVIKSKKIRVHYPHIITKGYLSRIIYWNGVAFCQERISNLNN